MVGFGANRRGGRLPSLILIFLMVLIVVVSYNYWSVTRQHGRALDELAEVQAQVKRTDAARSRLEKRNSELMLQVDTHRRQIDQKDGDYSILESKLQARDALVKKCTDDKMKVQNDFTLQSSEITRLKEQVKELKQEIIRQEDQLRELKKNTTNLERKLEYESLQCGRQLAQLKDEYEESKRLMVEQAAKSKLSKMDASKVSTVASRAENPDPKNAGEPQPEAAKQHDKPDMKEEMGKPGSDAGMPGIEDSEVAKVDDMHFALKKPAITQTHKEHAEEADLIKDKQIGGGGGDGEEPRVGAGIREGEGAGIGAGFEAGAENAIDAGVKPGAGMGPEAGARFNVPRDLPLGHPDRPHPGGARGGLGMGHNMPVQQQVPQPVVDRPVVMDENNKADEFGEQQRQIRGRDGQGAALPPPPNPAQVLPNPIDPQRDAAPIRHRQNDEDREVPGDHGVDYGKRRQAMDIL